MHHNVHHDNSEPAFFAKDVSFTKIVVDNEVTISHYGGKSQDYTIYYAGTSDGKVYKVSRWKNSKGQYQSKLLDILDITNEPIRAMEISRSRRQLYITSDTGIRQIDLNLCTVRYDNCLQCSRDPSCGWDRDAGVCR